MNQKVRKHMSKEKQTIGKGDVGKVTAAELAGKKEAAPAPAKVQKLEVKAGMKYRGAREAWYQRLVEFNGKDVNEFLKNATDKPPSLTKANTAENPKGWLGFFKRQGVVGLVEQPAKG